MAKLRIEIVKHADGSGVLRCTRADGSITWQKQTRQASHFALHDMTHYAVESALGYRRGFFGLIAEGWDVDDTTGNGVRGALPAEAIEVEHLVGLFDAERASGLFWSVEEFNEHAPRRFAPQEIQAIRKLRATLFEKWATISPGEKLELEFDNTHENASSVLHHRDPARSR